MQVSRFLRCTLITSDIIILWIQNYLHLHGWQGNASTRKRIKNKRKPLKSRFFLRCFRDFFKFFGNPSKLKFWGVSSFFDRFTRFVCPFPLYFFQIFSRDFPIFFWSVSSFFKNFLIDMYPHIFDQFPQILRSVSSYFWFVSAIFKNFKNLNLLIGFLKF